MIHRCEVTLAYRDWGQCTFGVEYTPISADSFAVSCARDVNKCKVNEFKQFCV